MALKINFQKNKLEDYTYSDLHLDLAASNVPYGNTNLTRKSGSADIKADYDELAIRNSIRNLFLTRKGQRLLNPDYGLNIYQYVFEPVNEFTARLIARNIKEGIRKYESRVSLKKINLEIDPENQEIQISMLIEIPSLNRQTIFQGLFSNTGFSL